MERFKENFWWACWAALLLAQIVLTFLFYNRNRLTALVTIGCIILGIGFITGYLGVLTLQRKGEMRDRSRLAHTTVLVTSDIYSVVRHPQYLCWALVSLGMALLSQYWVVAIVAVAASFAIYLQARQDDRHLIKKFGDDYINYMQTVPRMNILAGLLRLARSQPGKRG